MLSSFGEFVIGVCAKAAGGDLAHRYCDPGLALPRSAE
jgi:hypothetical protein